MQRLAARGGKTGMDAWVKGGFQAKMDPKEAKQILGIRCVYLPPRSFYRRPLGGALDAFRPMKLASRLEVEAVAVPRVVQCLRLTLCPMPAILRDPVTVKKIKDAHRRIMIVNHPDRGGVCPRLAARLRSGPANSSPTSRATASPVTLPGFEDQRSKGHAGTPCGTLPYLTDHH